MKSLKYSGAWWLPSKEMRKVTGKVAFAEEDGLYLTLNRYLLSDQDHLKQPYFKEHPIILGLTRDGQAVTLCNCRDIELRLILDSRFAHFARQLARLRVD